MPTITAGQLADADEIRSYDDILAIHNRLCRQLAASTAERPIVLFKRAAQRVARAGEAYRDAAKMTDQIRTLTQTAITAVLTEVRGASATTDSWDSALFAAADAWLDQLDLVVRRPIDGR